MWAQLNANGVADMTCKDVNGNIEAILSEKIMFQAPKTNLELSL